MVNGDAEDAGDAKDDKVDVTPTELVGGELWDGKHAGGGEEEGGRLEDFLIEDHVSPEDDDDDDDNMDDSENIF